LEIGNVKFVRPKSHLLRKWIKGYYIHRADAVDFYSKVTFYQNITTTISIYRNSITTSNGRSRYQHFKEGEGFTSLLVGLVDKYQEVEFFGPLDRLAIVFYSGGINQFITSPLGGFIKAHFSHFDYYNSSFEELLPMVFDTEDLELKRDYLDAFFLEKFVPLNEPDLLSAIDILWTEPNQCSVAELASRLGMNRRTLLRKFKAHLGYSIKDYRSVIKFRKALLGFQENGGSEKLTQIALDSYYYDQSDFNHNMKSRSGLTPKELFAQLEIVDDVLFWKL